MSDQKTDFIIQAAILDKYISLADPLVDPIGVDIVIEKLLSRPDLYRYFFGQNPSAGWAHILLEKGIFSDPPNVTVNENGYQIPYWAPSKYLLSVAEKEPAAIVTVVGEIDTDNPIIHADLICALSKLDVEQGAKLAAKVKTWLQSEYHYWEMPEAVVKLIVHFAENSATEEAFSLLTELMTPIPGAVHQIEDHLLRSEANSKFETHYFNIDFWKDSLPALEKIAAPAVIDILETQLLSAIKLELEAVKKTDDEDSWLAYGWRSAIGDTDQDDNRTYKDMLLVALRDALGRLVTWNRKSSEEIINRYLHSDKIILRRLGIYTLAQNARPFHAIVASLLADNTTHNDISIHTEYFKLLSEGFPVLEELEKKQVLGIILSGPDEKKTEELAEWVSNETEEDREEYKTRHRETWIRDRLWAIRQYLSEEASKQLEILFERYGNPVHPDFLVWRSGGFWVTEVSPYSQEDMMNMDPENLLELLKTWKPNEERFTEVQQTLRGFAKAVAELILNNFSVYEQFLIRLIEAHPVFSAELFSAAEERWKNGETISWANLLNLAHLTSEKEYRELVNAWPGDNFEARIAAIRLVEEGLNRKNLVSTQYIEKIDSIVLQYLDDSNPKEPDDNPAEGWLGHNDPITLAENTIRPKALICFFKSLDLKMNIVKRSKDISSGEFNIAFDIQQSKRIVVDKLDRTKDPSWAVHSIFGRNIWLLYTLDRDWFIELIPQIFPDDKTFEDERLFASAWDSFIIFQRPWSGYFQFLRRQYLRAIGSLSQGKLTKSHLDPQNHLAEHLFVEYLFGAYDLSQPGGETNLLGEYFSKCDIEARGRAIWAFWRLLKNLPETELNSFWSVIRKFWEWRTRVFSLSQYPYEFAHEAEELSHFPGLAPGSETITRLWSLLQALLPYANKQRVWYNLEEFLGERVESAPDEVIKFYRLMHEASKDPEWGYRSYGEASDKILGTAIKRVSSRRDALAVIDMTFRSGNQKYRDMYEEYSH